MRAVFLTRDRAEWTELLSPADTCVAPVLTVPEVVDDEQFVARGDYVLAHHAEQGDFRQVGPVFAGMEPPSRPYEARDATVTDTDALLTEAASRPANWPSSIGPESWHESAPDVEELVGKLQYEEEGEFPVERGYFWTSAASVENANPIFWDDAAADEITGGPIAPLSLLSAWFRPHHWAPDRKVEKLPLQIHFDLKARFELPEAIMTENITTFHEPVRPGDVITSAQRLVSVSEEQTRRLGTGRFWSSTSSTATSATSCAASSAGPASATGGTTRDHRRAGRDRPHAPRADLRRHIDDGRPRRARGARLATDAPRLPLRGSSARACGTSSSTRRTRARGSSAS